MPKAIRLPLDWPLLAECGNCGGKLHIYPYPAPTGSAVCDTCSPTWLEDFLSYATEATRANGWRATA